MFKDCPGCAGTGVVKTAESMAIEVVRMLILAAQHPEASEVLIHVAEDVAEFDNILKYTFMCNKPVAILTDANFWGGYGDQ